MLAHKTLPALMAPAQLLPGRSRDVDALLAWGRRPSARRVERLAQRRGLPVWHLEDGLLRSLAKGRRHPPLCLLVDDLGVHFDATAQAVWSSGSVSRSATNSLPGPRVQRLWCSQRLSKLNPPRESPAPEQRFVLVVDQSAGDLSIPLGLAGPESFQQMLQAALAEHPDCSVVVKVHPDVIRGQARGHFRPEALQHRRIRLCADGRHPPPPCWSAPRRSTS